MEARKPGRTPAPTTTHGHPSTTDQTAHCRREAIRAQARGDHDQAEVWALLASMASAGVTIPADVLAHPPAYIAWEGVTS